MAMLPRRKALQWMGLLGSAPWLLGGCSGSKPGDTDWGGSDDGSPEQLPQEADLTGLKVNESLVEALNQFGWDLLRSLPEGNQFISPASVGLCLAMIERGAEGTTRGEIRKVLHLSEKPDLTDPGWKTFSQFLRVQKPNRQARMANALFLQSGDPVGPDFQNELEGWFQAKLKDLDFKTDPAGAAKSINQWVKLRSGNALGDLLEPDTLSSGTRLVLVNLIQFKGEWELAFDPSRTRPRDFETVPGQKKSVPFMAMPSDDFRIRRTPLARAIEIPCKGRDRSVHIIQPNKRHGLPEIMNPKIDLSWRNLLFEPGRISHSYALLPKFAFESNLGLKSPLTQLGMPKAFDASAADFSRMNGGQEPLFVHQVLHKARFSMDEKGVKAVAATLGEAKKDGKMEEEERPFIADHPFLVAITDQSTQSILFLGRLNDPTKAPIDS